jgi:hypothetical protein
MKVEMFGKITTAQKLSKEAKKLRKFLRKLRIGADISVVEKTFYSMKQFEIGISFENKMLVREITIFYSDISKGWVVAGVIGNPKFKSPKAAFKYFLKNWQEEMKSVISKLEKENIQ